MPFHLLAQVARLTDSGGSDCASDYPSNYDQDCEGRIPGRLEGRRLRLPATLRGWLQAGTAGRQIIGSPPERMLDQAARSLDRMRLAIVIGRLHAVKRQVSIPVGFP
jgi:hypothetical protein